jgi:hypothetical protein
MLILAVAVAIRLTYTLTTGHTLRMTSRDGQIAHNIVADGRWFVRNRAADAYVMTLLDRRGKLIDPAEINYSQVDQHGQWYPEINESVGASAVLAGLWAVSDSERYIQIQVLQTLLDGLAALLVYWIAMQLFRRRGAALLAASLYAVYPPIAWETADPYNDIWAVDFTIAIVATFLMILKADDGRRWRWLVLCGLLAGIGAYFRPQVLVIAPVLALASLSRCGWRAALRWSLAISFIGGLLLIPWIIRNYNDFHTFIPTRSAFWQTMWGGLAEIPNNFGGNFSEAAIVSTIRHVRPDLVPESPAWDSYIKPYFIHAVEQHPFFYVEVLLHRVALATFIAHENIWMRRGAGAVLNYKGGIFAFLVNRPLEVLEYALQPAVFLLAMLGLGFSWRRWRQESLFMVAAVVCILLPYLAMHVEERYLLPVFFAYFIWIGLGADLLVERIRRRSRRVSVSVTRPLTGRPGAPQGA